MRRFIFTLLSLMDSSKPFCKKNQHEADYPRWSADLLGEANLSAKRISMRRNHYRILATFLDANLSAKRISMRRIGRQENLLKLKTANLSAKRISMRRNRTFSNVITYCANLSAKRISMRRFDNAFTTAVFAANLSAKRISMRRGGYPKT